MQLSPHFTLDELTFSRVALARGIENTPPGDIVPALIDTASRMELVRALLGHPIHVDSAYRSFATNVAVGGVPGSAHLTGRAVDFVCPSFGSPTQIVDAIAASRIGFDQCIEEGGRWVHISFDQRMRRQLLTAHFGPTGRTSYIPRD